MYAFLELRSWYFYWTVFFPNNAIHTTRTCNQAVVLIVQNGESDLNWTYIITLVVFQLYMNHFPFFFLFVFRSVLPIHNMNSWILYAETWLECMRGSSVLIKRMLLGTQLSPSMLKRQLEHGQSTTIQGYVWMMHSFLFKMYLTSEVFTS